MTGVLTSADFSHGTRIHTTRYSQVGDGWLAFQMLLARETGVDVRYMVCEQIHQRIGRIVRALKVARYCVAATGIRLMNCAGIISARQFPVIEDSWLKPSRLGHFLKLPWIHCGEAGGQLAHVVGWEESSVKAPPRLSNS